MKRNNLGCIEVSFKNIGHSFVPWWCASVVSSKCFVVCVSVLIPKRLGDLSSLVIILVLDGL